ncbi:hypothetical protein MNBD_CPR01-355 [hydrothermal vent metagenome]|uniref:Uncharacterized protein n=1 Tax=hydrothermal vent metagenome TaxID=652676 RepID=A0A3B0VLK5_9ZZZZ
MSAESTLILTGVLVLLTRFLGLPSEWYIYIYLVLGIVIISIGIMLHSRRSERKAKRFTDEHTKEKDA